MKQKVVIKLRLQDQKNRSKAMKIAVSHAGVASASIEGKDNDQIVVTGEGIDSVTLTRSFRKAMGCAELVTVAAMDDKKEEEESASNPAMWWTPSWPNYYAYAPPQYVYDAQYSPSGTCIIM